VVYFSKSELVYFWKGVDTLQIRIRVRSRGADGKTSSGGTFRWKTVAERPLAGLVSRFKTRMNCGAPRDKETMFYTSPTRVNPPESGPVFG